MAKWDLTKLKEKPKPRRYYASECYGNFGVFESDKGIQVGEWWPSLEIAQQVAKLLNEEFAK